MDILEYQINLSMTIIIHTKNVQGLYNSINQKINSGELRTWEIKKDSNKDVLYNHSPEQWSDKVLLKPTNHPDGLQLKINWWKNSSEPDEQTKGYILGRFTEILMVHFRDLFNKVELK